MIPAKRTGRLLVISTSAGSGHTRAAQALEEAAHLTAPDWEVHHADILSFTSSLYRKAYAQGYQKLVERAPNLWGVLYRAADSKGQGRVSRSISHSFDKLEFQHFHRFVEEFAPDRIISTHFLAAQVLEAFARRKRPLPPHWLVLTDYDAHSFWARPGIDRFFVGNDETRAMLAGRGIDAAKITVSGIPVSPSFSRPIKRSLVREKLDLVAGIPTVLVMGGGAGVGGLEEAVRVTLQHPPVQVLAVTGRNEELRAQFATLRVPDETPLRVFGFVEDMASLMAVADLAVTKSGGLTTSECLAMKLPMVVRDPIPGQEERNCDYLVEAGAAVRSHGRHSLSFKLGKLLANPDLRRRMRTAAAAIAKPRAAFDIIKAATEAPE
ncbi:MAG: glycosyltransferase [Planctomycetota bacterium]